MIASCLPFSGETPAVPADQLAEIQARRTLKHQGIDLTREEFQFDLHSLDEVP